MSRQCFRCVLILAGALIALAPPVTSLADSGWVSPLGEIPLTNPLVTGARAAGMGFVSMAVADDGSAITSNPAALTRLNRAELSAGFRRGAFGIEGRMAGSAFKDEISGTDYASFRFAYPFPTFRGSLVLGLSAERIYDFRDSRVATYRDTIEGSGDVWSVREDYFSDGGITALSAACALDISPTISLGATFSYLTGDYSRYFTYRDEFVGDEYRRQDALGRYIELYSDEQHEADISGVRGTFGGLFYVSEELSIGVAVDTPVTLTFDGAEWIYEVEDSVVVTDTSFYYSDKIKLPFAFRGGVAYAPLDFVIVGVDVTYSDWSEMDYAGRITDVEEEGDVVQRVFLYEETLGYGVGVEVTVPSWPLRLRGGYARRPIAFNGMDVISERSYYTLGAGVLIDTVLAVDIAWMKGSYEREDGEFAYSESVDESALIVEATYRF